MQKAWLSLLGVFSFAISCFGFTMNRSEAGILEPGIWPGPSFHTDRRIPIKMFFNGKIHVADVDNTLRDEVALKKSAKSEEKCSSCSDDSLRVRRSDNHMENLIKIDNKNASKTMTSDVTSNSKTSDVTSNSKTSDVTSNSKTSDVTSNSKTSDVTSNSKTSDVTSNSKTSDVTSNSKTSDVTSNSKTSDVTSNSKTSDVTSNSKTSDVTSNSKTSETTLESRTSSATSESKTSDATSAATSEWKISDATSESKTFEVPKSETSDVTSESKISDVTAQSANFDVTSKKNSGSKILRNVILLLIDENGYEFPFKKFSRNCRRSEGSENLKFPLDESLVSGKRDECDCDRLLRENVGSLLSWAHNMKNMTTGAVSATNFSIPSPLGYEKLSIQAKDLEDEVNNPPKNAEKTHINLRTNWRVVELDKKSSLSSSTPTMIDESATKIDGVDGINGIWDIFDLFSRIRMAFFRILIESLGNMTGRNDELSGNKLYPVQQNLVELVGDTVKKLNSSQNENGFMLVVAAPGNELSALLEVLLYKVSPDDTLLVISGMCSPNDKIVPFFEIGPGGNCLDQPSTVWEVPKLIEDVIYYGCHSHIYQNKLSEEPRISASLPILPPSMRLQSYYEFPHKRIARAKEEDETTSSTGDDKTTKDSEDVDNNSDERTTVPEMEKRSGAEISRVDNVAAILGIVTSITAMFALNS